MLHGYFGTEQQPTPSPGKSKLFDPEASGVENNISFLSYRYERIVEVLSFPDCVTLCTKKRHTEGKEWNGFFWCADVCQCTKNESGHTPDGEFVHFKLD